MSTSFWEYTRRIKERTDFLFSQFKIDPLQKEIIYKENEMDRAFMSGDYNKAVECNEKINLLENMFELKKKIEVLEGKRESTITGPYGIPIPPLFGKDLVKALEDCAESEENLANSYFSNSWERDKHTIRAERYRARAKRVKKENDLLGL